MAAAVKADRTLGRAAQERARLGLLEQPGQLTPLALAQVPRPAAAAADELDDAAPFVRVELEQVLAHQQKQFAENDQAGSRKASEGTSKDRH